MCIIKRLKHENKNFDIEWKIIDRGKKFNPTTRKCNLCLKEKYNIIFKPAGASLNKRSELFSACRHRRQQLLANVWDRQQFHFSSEIVSKPHVIPLSMLLMIMLIVWKKFVQPQTFLFFFFTCELVYFAPLSQWPAQNYYVHIENLGTIF